MRTPLPEAKVKEHQEKSQKLKERHAELVEKEKEGRARLNVLNEELQEAEKVIAKNQREIHQLSLTFSSIAKESQLNLQQRTHHEKELSEDKFEKELLAEIKKQPTFYESLPTVLEKTNEELTSGLNGLENKFDAEEMVKKIEHHLDVGSRGYSADVYSCLEYINRYNQIIREVCRKKLTKEKITMRELQNKNALLLEFIMLPRIEQIWNNL